MTAFPVSSGRRRRVLWAAAATSLAVALVGCTASPDSTEPDDAATGAAALLPAEYREAGVITAATVCEVEPYSYCEPGSTTAIGIFPDIAQIWAEKLGVTVDPIGIANDAMIPAVASGRYDVLLALGDTEERRNTFDFIDILKSTYAIIAADGNPLGFGDDQFDLCGYRVASTLGGNESLVVQRLSDECVAQGLDPIENIQLGDLASVWLSVPSGRADAAWGNDVAAYTAEDANPDDYDVVMTIPTDTVFGIGVPKTTPELRDAIAAAMAEAIADGSYQAVLEKWNLADIGFGELMINLEPAETPGQ